MPCVHIRATSICDGIFTDSSFQKNGGGGPVTEVVVGLVDEVGEKMAKSRDAGGKVAKEVKEGRVTPKVKEGGGAMKVKEAKKAMMGVPNGSQRKCANPAKK